MKEAIRYHEDFTFSSSDAELAPFEFVDDKKDKDVFGNRIRRSEKLAYLDQAGNEFKAAIAITQEGQRLMKDFPYLLSDLDAVLVEYSEAFNTIGPAHDHFPDSIKLKNEGELTYFTRGGQSVVYLLNIGREEFVIKIKMRGSRSNQPYVNEMLQTQYMQRDLHEELEEAKIKLPEFIFASGQVSCTKLEPGWENGDDNIEAHAYPIFIRAQDYIQEQKSKGNKLWDGVYIDMEHRSTSPGSKSGGVFFPEGNFLTDGKILKWLDPFAYKSREPVESRDGLIRLEPEAVGKITKQSVEVDSENYSRCKPLVNQLADTLTVYQLTDGDVRKSAMRDIVTMAARSGIKKEEMVGKTIKEITLLAQKAIMKKFNVRFVYVDNVETSIT